MMEISDVGIDIINHSKIERYSNTWERFLTKDELTYANTKHGKRKISHISGIWAAKEAVIKAANGKVRSFKDIEITRDDKNKPYASLKGENNYKYLISISHESDKSIAIAIKIKK